MKSLTRFGAFILLMLLLASGGCRSTASLTVKGGGVGFLFEVQEPREGGTRAMAEAVKQRLEAFGVAGAMVSTVGSNRIRVLVPGLVEAKAGRVEKLLTRPTRVAFGLVDDGKEFFESLKARLPGDGSVRMATETRHASSDGTAYETCYLMATRRDKLEKFLKQIEPPEGRKLWLLPGEWGVLAYLVMDPPNLELPEVIEAKVVLDSQSGQPAVDIQFATQDREAFALLTRKNVNRRLAVMVDGEMRSVPLIQAAIDSGKARIGASPVVPVGVSEREARALAAGIRAWNMAGGLNLIDTEITPAESK